MRLAVPLLLLASLLLAACGGDVGPTQTPIVIVVTATPPAETPTPVPPTETPIPPSPTAPPGGITLELVNKVFVPSNASTRQYEDLIGFEIRFTNNFQKDIRAFSGGMRFIDLFGKEITTIGWDYTDGIKAGETKTFQGQVRYNQFLEQDRKLKDAKVGDITIRFKLEQVIYTDGTREEF